MKEPDDIDSSKIGFDGDEGDDDSPLFGGNPLLPFKQVISQFLPLRHDVDRLVAAYFRAKAVVAPFIHVAYFCRLYRIFWDNTSTTSPLWTSILFSILQIATETLSTSPRVNTSESSKSNRSRSAAAHCLAIRDYKKPQKFAFEALFLWARANCLTSDDISQCGHSFPYTLSTTDGLIGEVKLIYQELQCSYAALPVISQASLVANSIANSLSIIVTQLCVNTIYWKCLCVLHRPYVTLGRQISIQTCCSSATDIIRWFLNIHKEFEPGRQLETERWFMSTIT